jgi:hypothetical protein
MRRLRLLFTGIDIARRAIGWRRGIRLAWRLAITTAEPMRHRMDNLSGDSYLGDSY